jgi:hypothetical protein
LSLTARAGRSTVEMWPDPCTCLNYLRWRQSSPY